MRKETVWERTSVQNLLRNAESGRYFGRWTIGGKQIWRKLETDVFSVAKLRLADKAAEIEALRRSGKAVTAGSGTVGDLMAVYQQRTNSDTELKPASITARLVALKKLHKTWPELAGLKPLQVTTPAVAEWATRFKADGTNFRPPGAKTTIRGNSATSVNRAIDTLRRVMDIAVERGAIHTNPVVTKTESGRLKKKVTRTKLELPSNADVQRIFTAMENNGAVGGWGEEAADFCRFLLCSGCRVNEVGCITWGDVDWEKRQVRVRGVKTETSDRVVPLFAELETLLRKVIERRKRAAQFTPDRKPATEPADRLFRINECQKTIDRACATTGVQRITHHDFRHLFATRCIEAGVDIPTVAGWLGHSDGGVLAMKTYGHLRQDHSQAQAAKVSFGNAPV